MLAQNGTSFVANKIHPTWSVGQIEVTDDSPAGEPDTKAEIKVRIKTEPGQVSKSAINVELVTKRSRR